MCMKQFINSKFDKVLSYDVRKRLYLLNSFEIIMT